jgi:hypothetical protein
MEVVIIIGTLLIDSSGVARLFTTSEACVIDAHEDKASRGGGMGRMGGMDGMLVDENSEGPSKGFYYLCYSHDHLSASVHAETYGI